MSNNYKGKSNNNSNRYKGKYYDPNYKANKAKYGDLYDPKDFAVPNPNWESRNNQGRNNYKGRKKNNQRKHSKKGSNNIATLTTFILVMLMIITVNTDVLSTISSKFSNSQVTNTTVVTTAVQDVTSIEETVVNEPVVPDINSLLSNTMITIDTCNLDGSRQPNVMVDIGAGSRVYYGYTNEYSQLAYVQANSLQLQNSATEALVDGRYCEAQASVSEASGSYNRGHGIGDALGGVSNAYNIFPQLTNVNSGSYNDIEIKLQDALYNGGSVTDFELKLTYPNSSSNIPCSYTMSYSLNGTYNEHTFNN